MAEKIGIFGGAFDPIHNGHLILAQSVMETMKLDEIWFIPANYHIFKKESEISFAEHRYSMVKMAVKNNDKFKCLDIEIKKKKISYSYETLTELKKFYADIKFYFIIGADNLNTFNEWKSADKIFELCEVVVFGRPDVKLNKEGEKYYKKSRWIKTPLIEISSSEIRKRFMTGKTNRYLIPESVNSYINDNNIYSAVSI